MTLAALASLVLVAALAGCGTESAPPGAAADPTSEAPEPRTPGSTEMPAGPPSLTLHRPEGDVDLKAWTWCFQDESGATGCADGMPPEHPPETSGAGPLTFSFPLDGWSFSASFRTPGPYRDCERQLRTAVKPLGDGTFEVPALGRAGTWEVELSGNADTGGDLYTTFRWTTPVDSAVSPPAEGVVGLLGPPSVYEDKELEAYGPSLGLSGLAGDPTEATAEVVLSDGSASARYPMKRDRKDDCPGDGAVYFSGDAVNEALELPDLGAPPYLYEVHLTMDGEQYVGTGSWPEDLTPPNSNSLALTWSPPLPTSAD